MKAKITFDLNNVDDSIRHLQCAKAQDIIISLEKFARNRKNIEHSFENRLNTSLDWEDGIEATYKAFWDALEEGGINLDELCI